jgi:hypothetical protein
VGVFICEKHGQAGIVEACPHAAEIIGQENYHQFHRIEIFGVMLVCEECLRKYKLAGFEGYPSWIEAERPDEELDKAVDAYLEKYERLIGRRAFCSECVAAAEVAQTRREGGPDPFPVYERTFTANHSEALGELKEHLATSFEFRYSVVNPAERAVFVSGGNYRQPMTVTIYYVTMPNEQDFIVSLVRNFVARSERNQVRVIFFEAEVWTTWLSPKKPASGGGRRGKETLLREIFLNCP